MLPTVYDIIQLIVVHLETFPITPRNMKVLCSQFMHKGDMSLCTANNISPVHRAVWGSASTIELGFSSELWHSEKGDWKQFKLTPLLIYPLLLQIYELL